MNALAVRQSLLAAGGDSINPYNSISVINVCKPRNFVKLKALLAVPYVTPEFGSAVILNYSNTRTSATVLLKCTQGNHVVLERSQERRKTGLLLIYIQLTNS
jgi:hypothetical protein